MTTEALTPAAIIGKTLERLGEHGEHWSPVGAGCGRAENGGTECVAVALGRAAGSLGFTGCEGEYDVWKQAEQFVLAEFFLLNVPKLPDGRHSRTISVYNDHPETRWPAVKQVLANAHRIALNEES